MKKLFIDLAYRLMSAVAGQKKCDRYHDGSVCVVLVLGVAHCYVTTPDKVTHTKRVRVGSLGEARRETHAFRNYVHVEWIIKADSHDLLRFHEGECGPGANPFLRNAADIEINRRRRHFKMTGTAN